MTEKIVTRPFNYGDDNESEWPPKFGDRESGHFYYDKETRQTIKGFPPTKIQKFGDAPYIIGDTIDQYFHPGAGMWTDSKSGLRNLDKSTGCITTDKMIPADNSAKKQREAERKKDGHEALHKAVAMIDAGTAPLTEETRAMCERQNEIVSKALNMDAFNVAGRKTNAKGKRFRRK